MVLIYPGEFIYPVDHGGKCSWSVFTLVMLEPILENIEMYLHFQSFLNTDMM